MDNNLCPACDDSEKQFCGDKNGLSVNSDGRVFTPNRKKILNGVLNVTRLGDSLKIWVVK